MRSEIAIQKLEDLKEEAADPIRLYHEKDEGESWKSRVRGMIARSLGNGHHLVKQLDDNRYGLSIVFSGTTDQEWAQAFAGGVMRAVGYIDAAIYELELPTADAPVDERAFDPELWDHVKGLVESEDWTKIPSQVSIFVESHVRTWAALGNDTYGKGLYAKALADDGELRLGDSKPEWEGWRSLAVGFASAIGNVDRHRLQSRGDARRYAIGVLGLGSLLLTQLRHQHAGLIDERSGG